MAVVGEMYSRYCSRAQLYAWAALSRDGSRFRKEVPQHIRSKTKHTQLGTYGAERMASRVDGTVPRAFVEPLARVRGRLAAAHVNHEAVREECAAAVLARIQRLGRRSERGEKRGEKRGGETG